MPQILVSIRIADIGNGFPHLHDFVRVGVPFTIAIAVVLLLMLQLRAL